MASRRKFKKEVKFQTNLLIEDAFIEALNGDQKMDTLIDEMIDERFDILSDVANYPLNDGSKAVREHFNGLKSKLKDSVSKYSKKIGRVG